MSPYLFDEFFSSGREESISPFLTPKSRKWAQNLSLKSSLSSASLFLLAFGFSFVHPALSYLCLSFVYFFAGVPALIASLEDLSRLEINIDVLMTTAAFVAVAIGSPLEGALLLVLFEISHSLEETVSKKAHSALHNLNHIAPKLAHVATDDGRTFEKAVREIEIGERILVKNGEIVPLDGRVVEGTSSVNLVHLTGESLPHLKTVGDTVPAGARNLESALVITVERLSSDSTLTRIIRLIREAADAKPRLERWLDQFGQKYATAIIALTFLFALTLPLAFPLSYLGTEGSIYRALAFLIAASPCALIIATPTAYLSALSSSAKKGILLKGGVAFDALARCTKIAFDKTGTLTTGELLCTNDDLTPEELRVAYGLERQVVHPIATALCKLAQERACPPAPIEHFKALPGIGVEGLYNDIPVALKRSATEELSGHVLAELWIGPTRKLLRFTDSVRTEVPTLMRELQKLGLKPLILTGDHKTNAQRIGHQLGIREIYSELKPEDKLEKVTALSHHGLAMVGDGINDAPALARATVGISMGKIGSATAVDASDIVLLNDDLHHLSWLFAKARHTLRIVKQNVALALSVILLATTPALLGLVPLWLAVILHEGGTVLVGLNSLRLLRK